MQIIHAYSIVPVAPDASLWNVLLALPRTLWVATEQARAALPFGCTPDKLLELGRQGVAV